MTTFGRVRDQTGALGSNSWGTTISGPGAFVLEVVATVLLVFVVLLVTARAAAPGFAGLAIGSTLTVVHLVAIPLDSTSVNPARSIGPALFAGGTALSQLWLFIVAPLLGAVVAVGTQYLLRDRPTVADGAAATDPTSAVPDQRAAPERQTVDSEPSGRHGGRR